MHIVTFYSFKGGVGRTMALVNTAAELTRRGNRVLIVDFDLEAPGIQSYKPFRGSEGNGGIVEYVTKFIETGRAPDVSEYVFERKLSDRSIWLMPAGRQDAEYAQRLNAIDWLSLYARYDGYLMFEDLKQQWKDSFEFNYVLVDSRTGHTDVGGICTRQLPNAVVLMFFPNDQNLRGLESVVGTIRAEVAPPEGVPIYLHFCPSNVPDLDDEDQILQRHFDDAMFRLKYKEPASLIHHYNSLSLLDQMIFVQERPKTRLAEEYRKLVDSIVAVNLEDRAGALAWLEAAKTAVRSGKTNKSTSELEAALARIYKEHVDDGEVAWSLASVYEMLGSVDAQLETLNIVVEKKFNEARARAKRALVLSREGRTVDARDDLRAVVSASDVSAVDLASNIIRLREIDSEWLSVVSNSPALKKVKEADLYRVADSLMMDRAGAELASKLLLAERSPPNRSALVLSLIGSGQFVQAQKVLGNREDIMMSSKVEDVFNFGCAEWGSVGAPSRDLFLRVAELADSERMEDANFLQCMAMANCVIGKFTDAKHLLIAAERVAHSLPPITIFSCWRYLNVRRKGFIEDVLEMREQIRSRNGLAPLFLRPQSLALH